MNGSASQDTVGWYSSQLLDLDDHPIVMMNPESAAFCTAVDVLTAIQLFIECGMPGIPCSLTEFSEVMLQLANMEK